MTFTVPNIPDHCYICKRLGFQIVPDRAPEVYSFYVMCATCFENFVSIFPIQVKHIHKREIGNADRTILNVHIK